MRRHKFAEVRSIRLGKKGGPQHVQHTLIFLVDAAAVAHSDHSAAARVAEAYQAQELHGAAAQELQEATLAATDAVQVPIQHFLATHLGKPVQHGIYKRQGKLVGRPQRLWAAVPMAGQWKFEQCSHRG